MKYQLIFLCYLYCSTFDSIMQMFSDKALNEFDN